MIWDITKEVKRIMIIVDIPKGTRYISQYPQFQDYILKDYPILINKKLTGCGMSSYFLNKDIFKEPVILISPRKFMIQSKVKDKQFPYLIEFRPEFYEKASVEKLKSRLKDLIFMKINCLNETPKIITTYDSFKYVRETVEEMGLLDDFRIVVDEQQNIIKDSAFKGNTIRTLLNELNGLNRVIYISATPTPKKFNDEIPLLKDIETIELNWNKDDLRKINFSQISLSPKETYTDIIRRYKEKFDSEGYFKKKVINGKEYFSKELCIYVSNIEIIIHIIKALGLTNENCDVICSENDKTRKKLYDKTRRLGEKKSGFKPAKPKQIGEPHKTYTFITRCSYEGADFYSTNSTSIILSNPSVDCMSIDISIDLNQIIGRERLESNVFRDDIILYTYTPKKTVFNSFADMREKKLSLSNELLEFYQNTTQNQDLFIKSLKMDFSTDYIELDENNKPLISELRMLAEDYSENVRLEQFKGEKYIFKTFNESDYTNKLKDDDIETLNQFYNRFYYQFSFADRLELLCTFLDNNTNLKRALEYNSNLPQNYFYYYETLGTKILKACMYREDNILQRINILKAENKIRELVFTSFKIGDEIEVNQAKKTLNDIYNNLGLSKKAKSTDLKNYFNLTEFKQRINSKLKRFVRIESKK